MSNVILQPTSNKGAREHYVNTIINAVDIERIKKHIDDELYKKIKKLYPDGKVYVWGVTNGKKDVNKKKWEKIQPGDITLFAKDKEIYRSAVTTLIFSNKNLAFDLWGVDESGETWENIYLVAEFTNLSITYEKFSKIVGYNENYVIQGFNYLDDKKSERLLSALGLFSNTFVGNVSKDEYNLEVERLMAEEDLDKQINGTSRKEQVYLRKMLFRGKTEYECGICGRVYPVDLLITSHIKKRSDCSKEERLDVENIVMPMCKFGCDDLYEKGYLLVEEGNITKNSGKQLTKSVEEYIDMLEGKKCDYWKDTTKKYFNAHNNKFKI